MEPEIVDESRVIRGRQVTPLGIALPKGRLLRPSLDALAQVGLDCPDVDELDRRLVYETADGRVRFIIARPADVPAYVEHGAADLGITGKDVLIEGDWNVCELLDLGFGKCRMAVAAPAAATGPDPAAALSGLRLPRLGHTLRAATKFPSIARRYFAPRRDLCVQIIKLNGAVEIAPIVGLADVIVDIVDTGRTLADNGLVVVEEIMQVSARLIANRASLQLKLAAIYPVISALREQCHQLDDSIAQ
ncbi:MAG: ATP phosphoribosyltransferase [Bacillota bacterium]|jgi:ATP phosphoribosyltransferase